MARIIISLCALLALPVYAQQVSVESAKQVAMSFVVNQRNETGLKSAAIGSLELVYTAEQDGKNHFYVFNIGDEQRGFVIVGADEAAEEIIGYSMGGGFEYDKAPESFKWWLSQYSAQIGLGIELGVKAREKSANKSARVSVSPLISTQWKQKEPYNNAIPTVTLGSARKCQTGCGATAVAQIMKYYECPSSVGQGQKSYDIYYKNNSPSQGKYEYAFNPIDGYTSMTTFSADFGNTHYDWDNMLNSYDGEYSAKEAEAVSTLMYHVGVAMEMEYSPSGSTSYVTTAVSALSAHFGYDKSARYVQRDYYTDEAWEDMIYAELAAHRPVVYGGDSDDSGHMFVCDGYDAENNAYHINWGWGGNCDGYYALTGSSALNPDKSGTGNAAHYTGTQDAVVNLKPDEGGDYEYVINWKEASVEKSEIKSGENLLFGGKIINHSAVSVTMEIGAKFIRKTDKQTYYVSIGKITSLGPRKLKYAQSYAIATASVPKGSYDVRLVFKKSTDDGWREANTKIVPEVDITSDQEAIPTGISQVVSEGDVRIEAIYTIDGKCVNSLQKGMNIVRMSNGRVEKIVVK